MWLLLWLIGCDAFLLEPCPGRVWSEVSTGYQHVCAIDGSGEEEGEAVCAPEATLAPAGPLTSITGGYGFACALDPDGLPACWGEPGATWSAVLDEAPTEPLDAIAAGHTHVCGLLGGTVTCWGQREQIAYDLLTPPETLTEAVALSVGLTHTCALAPDGALACWGEDGAWMPDETAGPYRLVAAGQRLTCAQREDLGVVCWGEDPPDVDALDGRALDMLEAGLIGVCALDEQGSIACAITEELSLPDEPLSALDLSMDGAFGCALDHEGRLQCFGSPPAALPE